MFSACHHLCLSKGFRVLILALVANPFSHLEPYWIRPISSARGRTCGLYTLVEGGTLVEVISWQEAKRRAPKKRDTWARVLLLNWWVTPLTYLVARYTRITPSSLTLVGYSIGMTSGVCFVLGEWLWGPILYFIHFTLDAMDGKLSRIRGEDDTYRGMWDFIVDGIVCAAVVVGLGLGIGNKVVGVLLLFWMSLHFLDMRFGALVYNLKARLGMKEEGLIDEGAEGRYGRSKLLWVYMKVQGKFERVSMNVLPTAGEAALLMFIVGPILLELTGNLNWMVLMVILGCLCVVPAMVGNGMLAEKLAGREEE